MRTYPLLRNVHHRLTPVRPLRTRPIHIIPSCWTIYRSFEIILEMGTIQWIGIQCSMQINCFKKTVNVIRTIFEKILTGKSSSGSNGWARVNRERSRGNTYYKKRRNQSAVGWFFESNRKPSAFNCLLR